MKNKFISRKVRYVENNNYYLYFLYYGKQIVYIGQTNNLENRLSIHRNSHTRYSADKNNVNQWRNLEAKKWNKYRYIISKSDKLTKKWEKILIKKLAPKYNLGHNCNCLYYKSLMKKKIKNKMYYYYGFKRNEIPQPQYKKSKKNVKWLNYDPIKDKIYYLKEYKVWLKMPKNNKYGDKFRTIISRSLDPIFGYDFHNKKIDFLKHLKKFNINTFEPRGI